MVSTFIQRQILFKRIKDLLFNRFTIFPLVSVIISLIIISFINKYKAELISQVEKLESNSYYFYDLDNDGNSEKIVYIKKYSDRFGLMVVSNDKLIDHWDFLGEYANTISPIISDYDGDGFNEIFFFTIHNDTVLMHCLDAFNRKIEIKNKVVFKTYKDRGKYDLTIYPCSSYDVNADGYQEIFFSINSGYAVLPRNMFAYYPKKDSILISPENCSYIFFPLMFDFDGDNIPEFISSGTLAAGNCEAERIYSDQYSWLMVFTSDMKFKFAPVPFNIHPATSQFSPFIQGNNKYILVFHYYEGTENYPNFIALYDIYGKLIRKKDFNRDIEMYFSRFIARDDDFSEVYLLQGHGLIMKIDTMLNMRFEAKFENTSRANTIRKMDIDGDGENEFIIKGKNKDDLLIYRNNFSNPTTLSLNEEAFVNKVSIIENTGVPQKIYVHTDSHQYTFTYENTFIYRFRYALFLPIFLSILFIHFIILKIKEFRKLKKEKIQKQISELQVKSIQNQLDPHFTFNVFSSIASLINEKDTERANFIFNKYAALLKANVINYDHITNTLQEELTFVESYLELEKFRYARKFSFKINIHEAIDRQLIVPKMIMHIFVENAIKHGLKHLDSGGELLIDGKQDNGTITISIKDNGIGRAKAKEIGSFSTGKGLMIIDKIIDYYG
jgi:hypothetical protein